MNIDDLTIGEAREIASFFQPVESNKGFKNPLIGSYVLVRTYASGVHFGKLIQHQNQNIVLDEAIRIWKWKAKKGIALSGVAMHGLDMDYDNKLDSMTSNHVITDAIEIIKSDVLKKQLNEIGEYNA